MHFCSFLNFLILYLYILFIFLLLSNIDLRGGEIDFKIALKNFSAIKKFYKKDRSPPPPQVNIRRFLYSTVRILFL